MPETVTINNELGLIEVRSFGIVTSEDVVKSLDAAGHIHEETGFYRVLVDTREQTAYLTTIQTYKLAESMPRDLRIAVLITGNQATQENIKFAVTVAQNRGIEMRLFESRDDALNWVKG